MALAGDGTFIGQMGSDAKQEGAWGVAKDIFHPSQMMNKALDPQRPDTPLPNLGNFDIQNTNPYVKLEGLGDQLSSGTGAAQAMLTSAFNQAVQQSYGNAASMRGINPVVAARIANQGAGQLYAQGAQQAAMLRLKEMMGAGDIYNQLGSMRMDQRKLDLMPLLEQIKGEYGVSGQMANQESGHQKQMGILGEVLGKLSDRRAKTSIKGGADPRKELRELAAKTKAYTYKYKGDKKKRLGIMVQDLAKSKAGKRMLMSTKKGVAYDLGEAVSALLASNSETHRRLEALEKMRKAKAA